MTILRFDFVLFLKGMLMGAADIVPGVSGGTMAFITGIYERLLTAINSVIPAFLSLFRHRSLKRFWHEAQLDFLLVLFAGIISSVVLLASAIVFLMSSYPILLWSFFFGLILASVKIVAHHVKLTRLSNLGFLVLGAGIAVMISRAGPAQMEPNALAIFLSGAIAICAMILPGISGSFILVMLGAYSLILAALQNLDVMTLSLFALGCLVGLLSVAKLLAWALDRYHQAMLALLTGFMLGALDKVWPWKEVVTYRENRRGELVPLLERNLLPDNYELLTGNDAQSFVALMCALFAASIVLGIDYWSRKKQHSSR